MAVFRYTATRALLAGVSRGTTVELELDLRKWEESPRTTRADSFSIGGSSQSVLDRVDTVYAVQTNFHLEADLPALRQFVHSVAGLETFEVSPLGTLAVPGTFISVEMDSKSVPFKELRQGAYRLTFNLRAVP